MIDSVDTALLEWAIPIGVALLGAFVAWLASRHDRRLDALENLQSADRQDIRFAYQEAGRLESKTTVVTQMLQDEGRMLRDRIFDLEARAMKAEAKARKRKPRLRLVMHGNTPSNSLVAKSRLRG